MSANNFIHGVVRLKTPLHCASPDKDGNITKVMRQNVLTSRGHDSVPYFPGNDLRGRLRRKGAKLVLDHVCASSKVHLNLYAGLTSGAISGQPEADLTVEEALRARENVYMGLYGGGARMLRSRYSVRDLVPVLESTLNCGAVPEKFGQTDDQNFTPRVSDRSRRGDELIETRHFLRVNDAVRVLRPDEMVNFIQDPVASVTAMQVADAANSKNRKEGKALVESKELRGSEVEKKSSVANYLFIESIMAGTPMYFRLDFADDATDGHVGLMLMALRDLVREQALGGWVRTGFGAFDCALEMTRHGEPLPVFAQQRASGDAELSDATSDFVTAAREQLAKQTEGELLSFFTARNGDKADKKASKGAKE